MTLDEAKADLSRLTRRQVEQEKRLQNTKFAIEGCKWVIEKIKQRDAEAAP